MLPEELPDPAVDRVLFCPCLSRRAASTRRWCQGGRGPTKPTQGTVLSGAKNPGIVVHCCRGPGAPSTWNTKHPQRVVGSSVGAGAGAGVGAGAGSGVGVGVCSDGSVTGALSVAAVSAMT